MLFPLKSPFWQKVRVWFRRFRITVLLTLLGLLGVFIFLNQFGLPGFVRRPLLNELRARGIDLEFTRLRLRWYRGIVADNVRFGQSQQDTAAAFTAKSADLKLSVAQLFHGNLVVRAVAIHQGQFDWKVADTNTPARTLSVKNIEAQVRLLPDDSCVLDDLNAQFAGANFHASADIAHASAVRDWDVLKQRQPPTAGTLSGRLQRFIETLGTISFAAPPEFRLRVSGDARNPQTFTAWLSLHAPDATTPWGQLTEAQFIAHLTAATSNRLSYSSAKLNVARARTPWVGLDDLNLDLHFDSIPGATDRVAADLSARAARAHSIWASSTNLQFTAHWTNVLNDPIPLAGSGELEMENVNSFWAGARQLRVGGSLQRARFTFAPKPSLGFWTNLLPHELDWAVNVTDLEAGKLLAKQLELGGRWQSLALAITNLHGRFDAGTFDGRARLDVATREATFELNSAFDVHNLAPLLTERAGAWLAKYSWNQPPRITGSGAVSLPAWTDPHADWRQEVLPTLRLDAQLAITNGAYLGAPADWATTRVTYTNLVWWLPDLIAGRPEGVLKIIHRADDSTHAYYFHLDSTIDPRVLRPMLNEQQQRGLDLCEFGVPPHIVGEVWGRWHELDHVGASAHVALTNFSFRQQSADSLTAELRYTNRVLEFLNPHLTRGAQTVTAAGITADFDADRVYFTNGFSTAEPQVVAQAIGPKTARALEPFQFKQPPAVHVEGYAPLKDIENCDLRFSVDGGPFEWWRFHLPRVRGDLRWVGDSLFLTNMTATFYDGTARGHAEFKFPDSEGTEYSFYIRAADARLSTLAADLTTHSNRLEGWLSGWLEITNAISDNLNSWSGAAGLRLRDGLIWDIPIFGILSQPLNAVMPGLGLSRVSEATASGMITNGVAFTDDLEMRARTLRLQYRGTVDFAGRVDARVEAEPLRDAWIIGPVLNLALKPMTKMFEYKVTGSLRDPKTEPLHIPKIMMMPLHPFQTLEELFGGEGRGTNAPPVFTPLN